MAPPSELHIYCYREYLGPEVSSASSLLSGKVSYDRFCLQHNSCLFLCHVQNWIWRQLFLYRFDLQHLPEE